MQSNRYVGLLYIAPAPLFVAAFTLYPLGQLFWMSLHNWSLLGGARLIGFGNYLRAYQDPIFWNALFLPANTRSI
jgi:multiple sugar transport system permease protein